MAAASSSWGSGKRIYNGSVNTDTDGTDHLLEQFALHLSYFCKIGLRITVFFTVFETGVSECEPPITEF